MEHKDKKNDYSVLMIPVVVVNGIVSGIVSVIAAYFFRPIWNKLMRWWNHKS